MVKDYLEKVYSGFLGMNIGIRLGAPWMGANHLDVRQDPEYIWGITDYVKI